MCLLCGNSNGRWAIGRGRSLANNPRPKPRVADSKRRTQHPLSRVSNPRGAADTFGSLDRRTPNSKNGRIMRVTVIEVRRTQGRRDERVKRRMRRQGGESWRGFPVSGRNIGKVLESWWMFGNGRSTIQSRKNAVSKRIGGAHGGSGTTV